MVVGRVCDVVSLVFMRGGNVVGCVGLLVWVSFGMCTVGVCLVVGWYVF